MNHQVLLFLAGGHSLSGSLSDSQLETLRHALHRGRDAVGYLRMQQPLDGVAEIPYCWIVAVLTDKDESDES